MSYSETSLMKSIELKILASALLLAVFASGCGSGDIDIDGAWARPGNKGENSVVYFEISNRSSATIDLVDTESDVAEIVEIHRSMMVDGVMAMEKQERISIPAGGKLIFRPGDYHIMLIGLIDDTNIGDSFVLALRFANGSEIEVRVPVKGE